MVVDSDSTKPETYVCADQDFQIKSSPALLISEREKRDNIATLIRSTLIPF
jgi:hypothetical protein